MTRTRPFLQSITWRHLLDVELGVPVPVEPVANTYVPRDARLRAETHDAHTGWAKTWPIRLTDVGEHPGVYGDTARVTVLQEAR